MLCVCLFAFKASSQTFTFDFETDAQGWSADWADYPANPTDSLFYELASKHITLPTYIVPNQKGIYIKGFNHSDDLFMFLKKKLTGLLPNQRYKIQFQIELASDAPTSAIGIGGSPGLYLKAGATSIEPLKIKQTEGSTPFYRMNIDKGNQSMSGTQMDTIGKTSVSDTTTQFTIINRQNRNAFYAKSNANGELWAIVGTESAFEGLSELYYSRIEITLSAVTGTDERPLNQSINIYPNPSNSIIFVENAQDFSAFDIYDLTGRLVKRGTLPKESAISINALDVSFLTAGQYILSLKHSDESVHYAKFVKTN
jgi:hypothetical protein